jgi:uncharacterized membrane protein
LDRFWKYLPPLAILLAAGSGLWGASIGERSAAWLRGYGLSPSLIVLVISMLPIVELRGAIPVAIAVFGMPWPEAVLISVIGNMIPIPLILLFMDWFFALISKSRTGARFTDWLFRRTRRKGKVIERYEAIGLTVFVGIPLPGTGAWTGSFAANIFGIRFWRSLACIFLGVLIAAAIITPLSILGKVAIG